jgi:hypothetical protein
MLQCFTYHDICTPILLPLTSALCKINYYIPQDSMPDNDCLPPTTTVCRLPSRCSCKVSWLELPPDRRSRQSATHLITRLIGPVCLQHDCLLPRIPFQKGC